MQKITTFLWYDGQAEEAARLYTSLFDESRIVDRTHYSEAGPGEPGSVMTVTFELAGQQFIALNGGPEFPFTEAVSLQIDCANQEEVDRLWAALGDGGEEGPCGWIKDRFGLSWQVVPRKLFELLNSPDPERAKRVTEAMLGMGKIDVSALQEAHDG